jgi:hypothetical protein
MVTCSTSQVSPVDTRLNVQALVTSWASEIESVKVVLEKCPSAPMPIGARWSDRDSRQTPLAVNGSPDAG